MSALTNSPTITIPRLADEHTARYEARTIYLLMGADRSLDAVSQKLAKSVQLLKRWSTEDNWVELAASHDQTVYTLAAQAQSDQYQEDLKAFRVKYGKAGDDLHKVSTAMLSLFARHLQGKTVVDKDGNKHVIPAVEMNAGTLGQIKSALQAAADLEALALRVEGLLQSERQEDAR